MTIGSLLAAALLIPQGAAPRDFEALEKLKAQAFESEKTFCELLVVQHTNEGKPTVLRRTFVKDGKRDYALMESDGEKMAESGTDGQTSWVVFYAAKVYFSGPVKAGAGQAASEHSHEEPLEPGTFDFKFGGAQPFGIRSNPEFKIVSIDSVKLDGKPARLVTAKVEGPPEKRRAIFKQWFFPDKWLLRKAELSGTNKDGEALDIRISCTTVFKPKLDGAIFRFDPKKAEGFTKMSGPPPDVLDISSFPAQQCGLGCG